MFASYAIVVSDIVVFDWFSYFLLAAWPLHVGLIYMNWKRGGLAIDGGTIVARSGTIGIDYRLFPAFKAQDVSHIQSLRMRRHAISSLVFHTASTTIRVPYMDTEFMKSVVDFCAFSVESTEKSWM
jgi:putative membrane protein